MNTQQALLTAIIVATIAMFVWGRWRHDMIAMGSLLACVFAGIIPADGAFAGFSHPAVITVACVLILSSALQTTGAVDALTRAVLPREAGDFMTVAALTSLAAILSAFMNNVGALAILMPVAIQAAGRRNMPPGKVLMPLAFGSILGGMTTLVGTPPNLIVSGFREARFGQGFAMFDFTPVGGAVALCGVAFVVVLARWLVPARQAPAGLAIDIDSYLTEAIVPEKSAAAGMLLREVEAALRESDAQIVGMIRNESRIAAPSPFRQVLAGDILVIEADPEGLGAAMATVGLKLVGDVSAEDKDKQDSEDKPAKKAAPRERRAIQTEDIALLEYVVLPDADLAGRSVRDIRLRQSYGVNLLAVSRQGQRSMARLRTMAIKSGDVLLMQGRRESLSEFATQFGCIPLAERALHVPVRRKAILASGIMILAILAASFGLAPAAIAFSAGVLAAMAVNVVPVRTAYAAVDWPVIVLLGGMIPVAGAFSSTGTAELLAHMLVDGPAKGNAIIALTLVLIATMTLSDFMNNAATSAVMCPVAIGVAQQLGANPDAFLMAVAIGASCAFLTPIGHQNNTLILGRSGFGFGDYWRLGLPLEILIAVVAIPLLLIAWPL
jgi:di/tricarboxylate transporter